MWGSGAPKHPVVWDFERAEVLLKGGYLGKESCPKLLLAHIWQMLILASRKGQDQVTLTLVAPAPSSTGGCWPGTELRSLCKELCQEMADFVPLKPGHWLFL